MPLELFIKCYNITFFRVNYLGSKGEVKRGFKLVYRGIYTPLVYYAIYYSFIVSASQTIPFKLIVVATLLK